MSPGSRACCRSVAPRARSDAQDLREAGMARLPLLGAGLRVQSGLRRLRGSIKSASSFGVGAPWPERKATAGDIRFKTTQTRPPHPMLTDTGTADLTVRGPGRAEETKRRALEGRPLTPHTFARPYCAAPRPIKEYAACPKDWSSTPRLRVCRRPSLSISHRPPLRVQPARRRHGIPAVPPTGLFMGEYRWGERGSYSRIVPIPVVGQ